MRFFQRNKHTNCHYQIPGLQSIKALKPITTESHEQSEPHHYYDVIMGTIASQINSLTIVCSTVYSDADQRQHQSFASLAFVRGIHRDRWIPRTIHRDRWIPRTNGQQCGKCFHLMMSSWWFEFIFIQFLLDLTGDIAADAELHVKFQSDAIILISNRASPRLCKI